MCRSASEDNRRILHISRHNFHPVLFRPNLTLLKLKSRTLNSDRIFTAAAHKQGSLQKTVQCQLNIRIRELCYHQFKSYISILAHIAGKHYLNYEVIGLHDPLSYKEFCFRHIIRLKILLVGKEQLIAFGNTVVLIFFTCISG